MKKENMDAAILEEIHEEKKELRRDERIFAVAFATVCIFTVILFAGIAYLFFRQDEEPNEILNVVQNTSNEPTARLTLSPTISPTLNSKENVVTNKFSGAKDSYVNIGAGTNQSLEWSDVLGASTTVDIASYENIKEVHLEAFINVPTANGTVSVRLFNKTDNYAVVNSEVTRDGTKETYQFISPALIYDRGPKLYQIQMKSQLNVLANLVSARVRIITE